MTKKFIDFDAFFETQDAKVNEPLSFVFKKKTYTLPPQLSAAAGLLIVQLKSKGDGATVEVDDLKLLIDALIGKGQATQLFNDGVTLPQLEEIIKWITENYFPALAENNSSDSGNVKTPEAAGEVSTTS
ncbi:MAG: hypothetical protein ABFD54_06000 [Armatimonadota bacterium]|nr:hypothetical protein [bacterium]